MKVGKESYPLTSLRSNQKYGAFLKIPRNLSPFARIFTPHSNGHLSPIHEGCIYNVFLAQLLSRKEYYVLRRNIRPDVVEQLEECDGQWAGARRLGGAACGDESVVLHKGIRAGPLRMFIARNTHSTGIKLYCLADATSGYVVDMYLYTGRRVHLRRVGNTAGNLNAQQIRTMWAGLLPTGTILCADSFFGSHELARDLDADRHAFLMMTQRSTYRVDKAGQLLPEGQTATCTVDDARYAMVVFKNPKVGHKPPRVVPMHTNVYFLRAGPVHRRGGNEVNPVVASYRMGWMA